MTMITEAELKEFVEDTKWLHSHYDEMLDKYNDQYIAIQHQDVLDSAKNIEVLRDKLERRNIKAQEIFIEYIKDRRNEIY
jgi:predicted DNA-binding protein (UPF0278 family)